MLSAPHLSLWADPVWCVEAKLTVADDSSFQSILPRFYLIYKLLIVFLKPPTEQG